MKRKSETDPNNAAAALRRETALAYYHLTLTDGGKHVLADILRTFPPDALRFGRATNPSYSTTVAAITEGQAQVSTYISGMINQGQEAATSA